MRDGPDISRIANLIGDPARTNMLEALIGGMALTATELANEAGVTPQTASAHLFKLTDGGLLTMAKHGRHRYFRIDAETAEVLESLMIFSADRQMRTRPGPRDAAMRHARVCYDHLAGEVAIAMVDSLAAQQVLVQAGETFVTGPGADEFFLRAGIDLDRLKDRRRPLCRACMDWSMRRPHLAGSLGAAIFDLVLDRKWAWRENGSRVVRFSPEGKRAFGVLFPV